MAAGIADDSGKIPLFLLKTKSIPGDAYEELFSSPQGAFEFEPEFIPVLEHQFEGNGLKKFDGLLKGRQVASLPDSPYGGLIFTSQRAVEAFARIVSDGNGMIAPRPVASLGDTSMILTTKQGKTIAGRICRASRSIALVQPRLGP